jgi:hypothetical protein
MKRNYGMRLLLCAVVLMALTMTWSTASMAQIAVGISVRIGPPALPVYAQPICPGAGYFWTPGYWGWNDEGGYYWVPGTWVVAPVGMLWTPGYWGWGGGFYAWHGGYWGPHVGFYGGINYGFGYGGVGFGGGEWRGGAFYYNRSVTNVNVTNVTNVYNRTVVVNNESHVAFNGGEGGVAARATAQEEAYGREPHQAAIAAQVQQEHAASQNRASFASENHGRPAVAATARPGEFSGRGVVEAKAAGAEYHAPAMSPKEARGPSTPAGGATRGNAGANNNGFHSFTPPNKSNTVGPDHAAGVSNSGGSNNNDRGGAAASNGSRPAQKFTPPSSSHSASSSSSASSSGVSASGQARSETNTSRSSSESLTQSAPHTSSATQSVATHKNASKPVAHKSSPHNDAPHERK